jgi:hypothetical protein
MKKNTLLGFTMAAGIFCAADLTAQANTITTGTTIPGNPVGGNPYSGTGIPYDGNSTVTTITETGLHTDTLTLALAATAHGYLNPATGNPSYGVYTANTGLSSGRSLWNFDFYISSALGNLADYTFILTETGPGGTYSFNPLSVPNDNVGTAGYQAGNSESLDFSQYGGNIGYNPNQAGLYTFTLTASVGNGNGGLLELGGTSITVNASSVPDSASTVGLLGAGLAGLIYFKRTKSAKASVSLS